MIYPGQRRSLWNRYGTRLEIPPVPVPLERRKAIHITDLESYTTCRRRWNWASGLRAGLQSALLPTALLFGQAQHAALSAGYAGCVGEDRMVFSIRPALKALDEWYQAFQARVREVTGASWVSEQAEFEDLHALGKAVLRHYGLWAAHTDRQFRLLSTEQLFELPIPNTLDLKYVGRFDGIVQHRDGEIFILEFKTSRSLQDQYVASMFRSIQGTAYVWAAQLLQNLPVAGVLYRIMLKRAPDDPVLTSRGQFSRRKTIKSSADWYEYYIKLAAAQYAKAHDEEASVYETALFRAAAETISMLRAKGNEFFLEHVIHKTASQLAEIPVLLRSLGREMASPHTPVFAVPGFQCRWCAFREPCTMMNHGLDPAELLEAEYAPRGYWEPPEEENSDD